MRFFRTCRFETMESRQLLSVTPANVGVTYLEDSSNSDGTGDVFEISFSGGVQGTQLTQVVINLDKNENGAIDNDECIFDVAQGGLGVNDSSAFQYISDTGNIGYTSSVSSNGRVLTLTFNSFDAGDKFVFTIDVDEKKESGWTEVAEGSEFDGSLLTATLKAHGYYDETQPGTFVNNYDFSGKNLNLPNDDYTNVNSTDYTPSWSILSHIYSDGALVNITQTPKPIKVSGYVYDDHDADLVKDSTDGVLKNVEVQLWVWNDDAGKYVDTGDFTYTDDNGFYEFTITEPGKYQIVEVQDSSALTDYISVGAVPGTVGSVVTDGKDILTSIDLDYGDESYHNDFFETKGCSLSGTVYYDADWSGTLTDGDTGIGGVTITIEKVVNNKVTETYTTTTMPDGSWIYDGLLPGEYRVTETQPTGYNDSQDTIGTAGGTHYGTDSIYGVTLEYAESGKNYNFGEVHSASIKGIVFVDSDEDGLHDSGEKLLEGVTIYLLDESGSRFKFTTTDSDGSYSFTGLKPAVYGVEEVQPAAYLDGIDVVGTVNGVKIGELGDNDHIIKIDLSTNSESETYYGDGIEYNFAEILGATISGYVFQDGPTIALAEGESLPSIPSIRDGVFTSDDSPIAGVKLQLCDGSGYPLYDDNGNIITTVTDASGHYAFTNLKPGSYSVIEIQPTGYITGIDTAGSVNGATTGLAVNCYTVISESILKTLAVTTSGNAIVKISIGQGESSIYNNFSLVKVTQENDPPPGPNPTPDPTPWIVVTPDAPGENIYSNVSYTMPALTWNIAAYGGGGGPGGNTWHLSVINGGQPRSVDGGLDYGSYTPGEYFDPASWTGAAVDQGTFTLADSNGNVLKTIPYGLAGARPVVGKWSGDGLTKVGVFLDGYWFLDLNGDGIWDESDLWIKLGDDSDLPVAGDWDGDGKSDIGIFGRAWLGDPKAVERDPGLPDAMNTIYARHKNMPPDAAEATVGYRTLKRTSGGTIRSDVIDHVFEYGTDGDISVSGDWNGDGIFTVGIFRHGKWFLDNDGDGRWSEGDVMVEFGQDGDIPVVGDWTGDGTSKLGVYRHGSFVLDTNNNRQIDAQDKVFELGQAGDRPIAGDFTGSGVDTVGVYHAPADKALAKMSAHGAKTAKSMHQHNAPNAPSDAQTSSHANGAAANVASTPTPATK